MLGFGVDVAAAAFSAAIGVSSTTMRSMGMCFIVVSFISLSFPIIGNVRVVTLRLAYRLLFK